MAMLERLLPRTIDNNYRGHPAALWLLGVYTLLKIAMSINVMFNSREVLMRADGIPVDTYPAAAAQTIMAFFALFGFFHLLLTAMQIGTLVRYRSFIPFMYVILIVEAVGRRTLFYFRPFPRVASQATAINVALLVMLVIGLAFSLRKRS
jgi:hypothetical protein